jgi:hypothetical protein
MRSHRSHPPFDHGAALRVPPPHDSRSWRTLWRWLGEDAQAVADLERALTVVAWHEHAKRDHAGAMVLSPGTLTVVRARIRRPSFERIPKTHTRLSVLARSIQDQLREVNPSALVGLSRAQNRDAVSVLAHHRVFLWGA